MTGTRYAYQNEAIVGYQLQRFVTIHDFQQEYSIKEQFNFPRKLDYSKYIQTVDSVDIRPYIFVAAATAPRARPQLPYQKIFQEPRVQLGRPGSARVFQGSPWI